VAESERCEMCKRKTAVELVGEGFSKAGVARLVGHSRTWVYKWKERFEESGWSGLKEHSRARHDPGRLEGPLAERLVSIRMQHPTWGPRKILTFAERKEPLQKLPAASTVGELLKRRGLVRPRQRGSWFEPFLYAGPTPSKPNARWTMDFKGDFRVGNGTRCLPFTARDAASRLILSIRAMPSTAGHWVRSELERLLRKYGMPDEGQSDTVAPFATTGLARLSSLGVWLLKLDILPVLGRPGKPQDNGAHERMHRDLKAETTRPPAMTLKGQQRRFDDFRRCFNEQRPHEALNGDVPLQRWKPSSRQFPSRIEPWCYPAWWEVRRVNGNGTFTWKDTPVKCNDALGTEDIGLEPFEDGLWRIHFRKFVLGLLDERAHRARVIGLLNGNCVDQI